MTAKIAQRRSEAPGYAALLDRFDTFLFDLDGVIWTGLVLVPGVADVLTMLRSKGKNILFVTNNSSKSRETYKKAFDGFGIQASVDEIFGSAYASAIYLSQILNFPVDKKVYVIGTKGIEDELKSVGINFTGGSDPEDRILMPSGDHSSINNDPSIGAVLCGGDHYINYKKYAKAHTYIMNNSGCKFLITNGDGSYPDSRGTLPGKSFLRRSLAAEPSVDHTTWHAVEPACGAISAPISLYTGRTPTIIGKPSHYMMDCILAAHDFDPARTIMVGDNLDTDILFGINSGIATLLVMTGVTDESLLSGENKSDIVPDYIVQSMGDFAVLAD
ncbi:hypothetical protein QFC24_005053 [Naganishia onofrii]|uniref:Uncharacterized protein n=1 Tax=Naganishia onofrii TaxID=1851511 RepID=A0ACC2XAW4_9TREE|nr:hypothetical protein QFC24_005053 [Naganishia onofrii]